MTIEEKKALDRQEKRDFKYITELNNDIHRWKNLRQSADYSHFDAYSDEHYIEIKERKKNRNDESYAYSDVFIEPMKAQRLHDVCLQDDMWADYVNIFTASADTRQELIFIFDLGGCRQDGCLEVTEAPLPITSMKETGISDHFDRRIMIDTMKALDNKRLKIYARGRKTGKWQEFNENTYTQFRKKFLSRQGFFKHFTPMERKERDEYLNKIFHI